MSASADISHHDFMFFVLIIFVLLQHGGFVNDPRGPGRADRQPTAEWVGSPLKQCVVKIASLRRRRRFVIIIFEFLYLFHLPEKIKHEVFRKQYPHNKTIHGLRRFTAVNVAF